MVEAANIHAEALKVEGNDAFKRQDYQRAITLYT
jgi:hypothetical protein